MKTKKAILLTLSTFFLATLLFSLVMIGYNYNDKEKIERAYELSALDRLFDLSTSIQECVMSIFRMYVHMTSKVTMNPDGTYNITIYDRLSRTDGKLGDKFNNQIQDLKNFAEKYDRNVYLNLTVLQGPELPLVIKDYNITYTRSWAIGHIVLSITPQTLNFKTYDITVNTEAEKIKKMSAPGIGHGSFPFRVIGKDNYGQEFTESHDVDPSGSSQVQIQLEGGNSIKVTLNANVLEIWTNSDSMMSLQMTIGYITPLDHEPRLNYFEDAVRVNFPDMGFSKNIPIAL